MSRAVHARLSTRPPTTPNNRTVGYCAPMSVLVRLMGAFSVEVDGRVVDQGHFQRRTASAVVKVLALTPNRRMHREQLMDSLWPHLPLHDAANQLHKAAHYAPGHRPTIRMPLGRFSRANAPSCCAALGAGRELVAVDSTDEQAHLGVAQALLAGGDRAEALRQLDVLEHVLRDELGIGPSPEPTTCASRPSIPRSRRRFLRNRERPGTPDLPDRQFASAAHRTASDSPTPPVGRDRRWSRPPTG